jgi:hypothetical protein
MRLGTETGSLINHVLTHNVESPAPFIGMAATLCSWTDRSPGTVIAWDGKLLRVQTDKAIRTDSNGFSECQEYTYEADHNGSQYIFKRDRNGKWRQCGWSKTGRVVFTGGHGIVLGRREKYHDYSF